VQELRDLARAPLIAGFVADPPYLLSTDFVQGINLDIDPYWLRMYRASFAGYVESESGGQYSYRFMRLLKGRTLNWDWRPSGWNYHCRTRGYAENSHPARVIVLLRELADSKFLAEAPRAVGSHPIRYEPREPCVAHALSSGPPGGPTVAPGKSIGRAVPPAKGITGTSGTLGGFLRDSSNTRLFAVSCEHVCGGSGTTVYQPPPKSPSHSSIGSVIHATSPSPAPKCNRVRQPVAVADLALIELHPNVVVSNVFPNLGTVQRVTLIGDMTPDDLVLFEGATSGHVDAKIAALNLWREVLVNGVPTCFGDMFTIESRQAWYVKPSLSQPGDSGAWILNQTNGITAWDGMLVGGDGVQAYCCFAESLFAECEGAISGLTLP
jgi:hypothetical protein